MGVEGLNKFGFELVKVVLIKLLFLFFVPELVVEYFGEIVDHLIGKNKSHLFFFKFIFRLLIKLQ